jgi:tRNA isopentenyl-2-thiomethyl-A-37 hydroxylase MiaE
MMKAFIETKSGEESVKVAKLTTEQIAKYFTMLEQSNGKT